MTEPYLMSLKPDEIVHLMAIDAILEGVVGASPLPVVMRALMERDWPIRMIAAHSERARCRVAEIRKTRMRA